MSAKVVYLICLAFANLVRCEKGVIYKTKNLECQSDEKYAVNVSCRLKAINWNKTVANMDVDLVKPLKNITVRGQLFQKDYSNKFQPFLVDVTLNLCSLLSKRTFSPYGVIGLQIAKRFSNLNHSCPYEGHLFGRDIYLDQSYIPNNFPLALYKINISIWETSAMKMDYVGAIVSYIQAMEPAKSNKKGNVK